MSTVNVFRNIFEKYLVNSFPSPPGGVITVASGESPYDGFLKLLKHNILSAPVYDLVSKKYTGFLDMRDLVSFVVFIYEDQQSECPNDLKTILSKGIKLFKVPVDGVTVTYLSRRNVFKPVSLNDNMWTVLSILGLGVHRVPVLNEQGQVVNIISQSSVAKFISEHINEFGPITNQTIEELKIGTAPVVTISKNKKAIDAFSIMDRRKLSGVAVVDEQGKLVGSTTASDLKLFLKNPNIDLLKQPIMAFLNQLRQESTEENSSNHCCNSCTFKELMGMLSVSRLHRIFVTDDKDYHSVPIKVVSLTDILRFMIKNTNQ